MYISLYTAYAHKMLFLSFHPFQALKWIAELADELRYQLKQPGTRIIEYMLNCSDALFCEREVP